MFCDRGAGKTIGMTLDEAVESYGDREAFVFSDKRLSFHGLGIEANKVARAFLKLGVQPGDQVGGEQLSASEVEERLLSHPDVKEAAAIGRPEARLGEICVAFVELAGDAKVTEEELLDFCRKGLASFKVPRQIYFVSEWPLSSSGKIQKSVLTDRFHWS